MPAFLLEIGCEEIPARMIAAASEELKKRVDDEFDAELPGGRTRFAIVSVGY